MTSGHCVQSSVLFCALQIYWNESPAPDPADPAAAANPNRAPEVDTGTAEELQRLISGVEQAVEQAQELLELLESTSAEAS